MIGWLEDNNIIININCCNPNALNIEWEYCIDGEYDTNFCSRKEATIAAIDAALDYLIKNKRKWNN